MAEKTLKSRIIHKHDTAANWLKGASFIPKQGEIIVYDIDADHTYERFKIGDGKTAVNSLPFAGGDIAANALESAKSYTDAEIAEWVGDKTVSVQVQTAMATKADSNHTHDDRYYTESEINTKLDAKSDKTHTHDLSNASVNYAATAGVASSVAWANVQDKPSAYTPATHNHSINDVTNLQVTLDGKVPTSRKVNGKALTGDITLSASDVGADAAGSANTALTNAKTYTSQQITNWVGDKTVAVQIGAAIDDAMEYVEGQIVDPVFYVTFTKQANGTYTADKTYADVSAAYAADQTVMGLLNLGTGTIYHIPVLYCDTNHGVAFHTSLESSEPITIGYGKDGTIVSNVYDKIASKTDISDAISKITHPVTSVNNQTGAVKLTASSVGADAAGSANTALTNAKSYTDTRISAMVGDTTVATQISDAVSKKADTGHTHDDRYYTETEMDSKLNAKLSLSGGTLTGNLTLDNAATTQAGEPHIQWATVGGNKPYTGFAHDQSDGTFIICSMEKDTTTNGVKYYKNGLAIGGGSGNLFWKGSKVVTAADQLPATTSADGLMSASDKKKLNGIADGATKVTVDTALSSTSTNPVQNKIVNSAISNLKTLVGDTAVATQISNAIAGKSDTGHTHDDKYYTESEVDTKLSGKSDTSHTHSAYANQNAFSNVKVGSTTIAADSTTDTLTLAGSNVTITPDATNDKVTIGITKDNVIAALGYTPPTTDTKVTVDSALSGTSTNPVQNKVVNTAISNLKTLVGDTAVATQISNAIASKADTGHTHTSYVNQNAFSNVKVGSTTVAADSATDTLTLAGSNVTITPDATNDKITIGITKDNVTAALGYTPPTTNTTYDAAGSSLGLVKSGGDVSISSGVITVNDDSHNHIISNVDGLAAKLNLIGDTAVATQINNAINSHTHTISNISNIVISATQPSSPTTGMLWFDIS